MVLKRIKHVDKKPIERSVRESLRVLELRKKFPLIDDRCDRLFIDYFDLGELLHGVKRLELFAFYLPHLHEKISVPRHYLPCQSRPCREWSGI